MRRLGDAWPDREAGLQRREDAETKRGREQQVPGADLLATLDRTPTARPDESARFCIRGTTSGKIKDFTDP